MVPRLPRRSGVLLAAFALLGAAAPQAGQADGRAPTIQTVQPLPPETGYSPADPPYVAQGADVVEYASRSAIARLARRWGEAPERQVVIAHFGDSHVQKGTIVDAARRTLEADRGYGGRGMVFPYSLAKTYSQSDYDSSFTGTWRTGNSIQQPPRIPVGVSGFAATTTDQDSSVTLSFKQPLDPGPKRVRVFYSGTGTPYELTLLGAGSSPTVQTPLRQGESPSVAEFRLDGPPGALRLAIHARDAGPGAFTLRGISIENAAGGGVLYHNLGVGGAMYAALLQQTWFEDEVKLLKPDLVILDWGTNDLIFSKVPSPAFEDTVRNTIARVRRAAPEAAILVAPPQDMTWRGRDLAAAADLSDTLRRVALSSGCLYWDWYRVAGGPGSSARWRPDGLQGSDGIHLTSRGYRLKGRLLATALLSTIGYAREHPSATAFGPDTPAR